MSFLRRILSIVGCLVSVTIAGADEGHPIRLRVVEVVQGRVLAKPTSAGHRFVLVPRSAWETTRPTIELRSENGEVLASAYPGADVVDASRHPQGIAIAMRRHDGLEIALLDERLQRIATTLIERPSGVRHCRVVPLNGDERMAVLVDDDLYTLSLQGSTLAVALLQSRTLDVAALPATSTMLLAVVHSTGTVAYVTFFDRSLRARFSPSLPLAEAAVIDVVDSLVVIRSPIDQGRGTHVVILESYTGQPRYVSFNTTPECVAVSSRSQSLQIGSIVVSGGAFVVRVLEPTSSERVLFEEPLPAEHGVPRRLYAMNQHWLAVSDGGIVMFDPSGRILASDTTTAVMGSVPRSVTQREKQIVIRGERQTLTVAEEPQPLWWFAVFVDEVLAYVVPGILLLVIVLLRRHSRHLASMLDAMLELPGAGMVFHLDANARLIRANEAGSRLLRITKSVPMRRLFRSYATHKDAEALLDFVQRSHALRLVVTESVVVGSIAGPREYLFTSVPIRGTLGRFIGMLITGVDITEELERRRLVNWAQLAHDMQTNLSTIRLNAEQLKGASTTDVERRRRILFQVGVLIQRVRDLVSVGRSDTLDRAPVHSAELCTDIRHEFDSTVFPHVTFQMKLRGTIMIVDRLKISRAIRNAVENGIKALKGQPGTIEIATWFDRSNVYIRVSDTGVGMDTETLANMMKPHFTTAKDGSGTGIGTMIMQHVMSLHGGSLRVMSAPGKGTQVVFRIPLGTEVEPKALDRMASLS